MTNDEKLSEWGECFHSQTNVCGKAISWPCASVFSEHPSSDYFGRYVLPPPTPRRHDFYSATILLPERPCLADLQCPGVVRREAEHSKLYRAGLRIYPCMSFGAFETCSPRGRISGGQESASGFRTSCGCPCCRHPQDRGQLLFLL